MHHYLKMITGVNDHGNKRSKLFRLQTVETVSGGKEVRPTLPQMFSNIFVWMAAPSPEMATWTPLTQHHDPARGAIAARSPGFHPHEYIYPPTPHSYNALSYGYLYSRFHA